MYWGWHVAPTLCVRGPGFFQHQDMVIDPSLFTTPVSSEVRVSSALGMMAPVGSVTIPLREPLTFCARAGTAEHAEKQNPSVVDQVSSFYAQHPQVVKALGGLALTIALQHMLQRR